jgi:hypothetical protein
MLTIIMLTIIIKYNFVWFLSVLYDLQNIVILSLKGQVSVNLA